MKHPKQKPESPKHTPGPWIYQTGTKTVRLKRENYCIVALETFGKGGSTDAAMGDLDSVGRLIAACPEMLEMLKRALETAPHDLQYKIEALIDRIEGSES